MKSFENALIIGKFMPVHEGHLAMVQFASDNAEHVHVLLGALSGEPIPGPLRFIWLESCAKRWRNVSVHYTDDNLPTAAESSRDVSKVWAVWLKKKFPAADAVVSSEPYGGYLAEYMGIRHLAFDPGRSAFPVSATMIRNEPWVYWENLPLVARPWFVKAVCVYGPESTGKTTMTERLAHRFRTEWVPEMARIYIGNREPEKEDIDVVAVLHANEITKRKENANRILFVDSDLITTEIYADVLFGLHPQFSEEVKSANRYDLHLLLDIDVPWTDDIQRNSSHDRAAMFRRFKEELDSRNLPYEVIGGRWEEREEACAAAIGRRWPGMEKSALAGGTAGDWRGAKGLDFRT